jgi:hypothetical protein
MSVRTLTLRELNRATLARQLLLHRHRLSATQAVERVAGLQGQWSPSPYIGLWTRVDGFHPRALDRALLTRRVLKATLMRLTVHLVSRADYASFTSAFDGGRATKLPQLTFEFAERHGEAARGRFRGAALSRAEMYAWLAEARGVDTRPEALPPLSWEALRIRGRIAHTPDSALWAARRMRFAPVDDDLVEPAAGRITLVRRYLAAFGPANRADIARWSGVRVRDLESAIAALEPLRRFRDESGRELLDLPRAPRPHGDVAAPVRLLPRFDNLLLSHDDRRRVVADEHRTAVIHGGEVTGTFLVDGFVAGLWSFAGTRVRLEPFAPLPRSARRELAEEASRLEAFVDIAGSSR